MKTLRRPALTAVGMTALFTLTACSGAAETYDFTGPLEQAPPSIEFTIPGDLAELNEDYVETRVLDSVIVSAVEAEDPSQCAMEYRFEYVDGGLDRLLEHTEGLSSVADGDMPVDEVISSNLTGSSSAEFDEEYGSAVVTLSCAASPTDDEALRSIAFPWFEEDDRRNFATAEVSVMRGADQDGELYIHEPEVSGWQVDSNGNWISA